jgi:hypothetical protein
MRQSYLYLGLAENGHLGLAENGQTETQKKKTRATKLFLVTPIHTIIFVAKITATNFIFWT